MPPRFSGGRSWREAVLPLRLEAPPRCPIGSSSAMPRSRWRAPPWREPYLAMACSATLPAIQRQITGRNSNIRLRTTQAEKTNDRQFPSPCGFQATGGNRKKHHGTPRVTALVAVPRGRGGRGGGLGFVCGATVATSHRRCGATAGAVTPSL